MRKFPKRNVLLDKLHKGFVIACMGVTLLGTAYLGMGAYHYFMVYKPEAKQRRLLEKQQLLAEGSSENLKDIAPTLKM